jgi:hypothetical protein
MTRYAELTDDVVEVLIDGTRSKELTLVSGRDFFAAGSTVLRRRPANTGHS